MMLGLNAKYDVVEWALEHRHKMKEYRRLAEQHQPLNNFESLQ